MKKSGKSSYRECLFPKYFMTEKNLFIIHIVDSLS